MSSDITSFAIRYAAKHRGSHVIANLSREEVFPKVGRILWNASRQGYKLSYVRVVPCVKRPGTKALWEMSRDTMDEQQLRHWCKVCHRKAYGC